MCTYLSNFRVFTHKSFVRIGQFWGKFVDVKHVDGDGHSAGQDWAICGEKQKFKKGSLHSTDTMWLHGTASLLLYDE